MNESQANSPQNETLDILQLARAIRFALVFFVLAHSYFSIRASLAIDNFAAIFRDMLGNHPLPPLTIFVLHFRGAFIAASILAPVLAIGTLFSRHVVRSFYIIGVLGLATFVQSIILYHGLSAPLFQIIQQMGGQPDP